MAGTRAAFETVAEPFNGDIGAEAGGINFGGGGQEESVNAGGGKFFGVCFERAGIFGEVFVGSKLLWVHENGRNHRRALLFGALRQGGVTGVQSSHGCDETDDAAFGAGLPR